MKICLPARYECAAACSLLLTAPAIAQPAAPSPHGPVYKTVPPMDATIETRLMPQLAALLHQLLREKRAMKRSEEHTSELQSH